MSHLATDEKLDEPVPRERDMDTQMLVGCSGFVLVSFGVYFLVIWPFLVWLDIYRLTTLGIALVAGVIPAFVVGAIASRKVGIAGAGGFVGGILAVAIFLYLRFEQAFAAGLARQSPEPEYPKAVQWIGPTGLLLAAVVIVLFFVDRKTIGTETDDRP